MGSEMCIRDRFGTIELIEILLLDLMLLSPINEDRPLPSPFLFLKGFIKLHSPFPPSPVANSSAKLKYALLPGQFLS